MKRKNKDRIKENNSKSNNMHSVGKANTNSRSS